MANEPTGAIRSRRPLPRTRTRAAGQIEVAVVQPGQLAHAQAGRVEHFQDRPIAQAQRLVGRRRDQQPPMSSEERKCGSERALRGLRSGLAGFDFVQPSRWPKRKKLRSEASRRAIVVLA